MDKELDDAQSGVEDGTSTGEANSTSQDEQRRQPAKVNLDDFQEFREWKSSADRRVADAEYAAQHASQRASQLEQQFHQNRMASMDDTERYAYQNQLLQEQLAAVQRQRELDAYAIQRQRDLEEIVRETGVTMGEIEKAPNVHIAWQIGNKFQKQAGKKSATTSRQEEIEQQADDRVDLGGGKSQGKASGFQRDYDDARKSYDMGKMLEVMAKSSQQGVAINEW